MKTEEFTKVRDRWIWSKRLNSLVGEFGLELVNYGDSQASPDKRLLQRAEILLEKFDIDESRIVEIIFDHYQLYCREHNEWMKKCGVPTNLKENELREYISARDAFVAVDEDYEFEGYLIHPAWEEEHKIQIEYNNGELNVES